jgi:hypothetical protein
MHQFTSKFQHRLWFAHHIGTVCKMNGKYFSIPLYHRRPPQPFQPRLTRLEKIDLKKWMDARHPALQPARACHS